MPDSKGDIRVKDHLIRHGTIMLAATVLAGVFNYGFQIAMVRMLGPKSYGELFSLISLFMIISLPAGTLQTIVTKYISVFNAKKEFNKMGYLLSRMFWKLSVLLLFLLGVYLFFVRDIARFLKIPDIMPVVLVGPILIFGILFPVYFGALQGLERFTELGIVQVIGGVFRLAFGVLFVYLGFGVSGAMTGGVLTGAGVLFISWWCVRDVWAARPYDRDIGKSRIYRYLLPVAVTYICFGFVTYIDVVIVKHYLPALEAGYYSGVSMMGKSFLFPAMAFSGAMFPKVSSRNEQGLKTGHILLKTLLYSGLVSLGGIAVCMVFPRLIITVLMSRADITAYALKTMVPLLRFVGFAFAPYGVTCIVINYYLARHWNGFIPFLVLGAAGQTGLLILFHKTLIQVLTILAAAGIFMSLCGVFGRMFERIFYGYRKNVQDGKRGVTQAGRNLRGTEK